MKITIEIEPTEIAELYGKMAEQNMQAALQWQQAFWAKIMEQNPNPFGINTQTLFDVNKKKN